MMNEYPHEIEILTLGEKVSDGGGGYLPATWTTYTTLYGFLDTPTSNQIYQAHQLQQPFDRTLYVAYREDISPDMRLIWKDTTYELVGKPMDQGGQGEVMAVNVREING